MHQIERVRPKNPAAFLLLVLFAGGEEPSSPMGVAPKQQRTANRRCKAQPGAGVEAAAVGDASAF